MEEVPPAAVEAPPQAPQQQQQQLSAVGASAPVAPSATTPPSARDKRIANGVRFLSDARVQTSPISRRVNFLKSKGLSAEEIVECFSKAGQPQSLDAVNSLINGATIASAAPAPVPPAPLPPQSTSGVYVPPPQQQQQQQQQLPMQMPAGYSYAPQPHQYQQMQQPNYQSTPHAMAAAPSAPPPFRLADRWKDVVIGTGAAALVSWGAWKAFEAFSPFEFRWKSSDPMENSQTLRGAASSQRSTRGAPASGARSGSARTSNSAGGLAAQPSSESEAERFSQRVGGLAPPLPPLPAPQAAQQMPPSDDASEKRITELKERIKTLEQELAEGRTTIERERREKAELAVNNGKLKGQVTSLGRHNDKNAAEVVRLTAELANAKSELDRRPLPSSNVVPTVTPTEQPSNPSSATSDASSPPLATTNENEVDATPTPAVDTATALASAADAAPLTDNIAKTP